MTRMPRRARTALGVGPIFVAVLLSAAADRRYGRPSRGWDGLIGGAGRRLVRVDRRLVRLGRRLIQWNWSLVHLDQPLILTVRPLIHDDQPTRGLDQRPVPWDQRLTLEDRPLVRTDRSLILWLCGRPPQFDRPYPGRRKL